MTVATSSTSTAHDEAGRRALVGIAVVQLLAIALWAGGLVALGAVVAPIVFRNVPAPTSADAMTLVFARFDKVTIACGAVALVMEAAFAVWGGKATRLDVARGVALAVAVGLAVTVAAWLTPGIAGLHHAGAVRNFGPDGTELERLHKLAEALAKGELVLLLAVVVLTVAKVARGRARPLLAR